MYETKQSKPPQILTLILLQTNAKDEREIKAIERTMKKTQWNDERVRNTKERHKKEEKHTPYASGATKN